MKTRIGLYIGVMVLQSALLVAQLNRPKPVKIVVAAPESRETFPPRVQAALDQAELYWGRKADIRHVKFTFIEPSLIDKILQQTVDGLWDPATHTIEMDVKDWSTDRLEVVITHEYGHALGLPHSDDPRSIMWKYGQESLEPWPHGLKAIDFATMTAGGGSIGLYAPGTVGTVITTDSSGTITSACFNYSSIQIGLLAGSVPIVTVDLPKNADGCGNSEGWQKVLEEGATWNFRIEGVQYTLTGAELAAAVKAAKDLR